MCGTLNFWLAWAIVVANAQAAMSDPNLRFPSSGSTLIWAVPSSFLVMLAATRGHTGLGLRDVGYRVVKGISDWRHLTFG